MEEKKEIKDKKMEEEKMTLENQKIQNEPSKIKVNFIPFVFPYAIIVTIIMYLVTRDFSVWPFYFILGTATSMFNFTLLLNYVNKTKPENLKRGMYFNYFIRFIMWAIVLGFASLNDGAIAMIPTAIGLLTVKIVMTSYTLIKRGEKV